VKENDVDDLVTWLRAQIAETVRVASATMTAQSDWGGWSARHSRADFGFSDVVQTGRVYVVLSEVTPETADHIALNDPAAVLAQCEAHTAILDRCAELLDLAGPYYGDVDYRPACNLVEDTVLPGLALAYRHRPGYREEWRP
jgi:hypothetical protein